MGEELNDALTVWMRSSAAGRRKLELRDMKRECENIAAQAAECLARLPRPAPDSHFDSKLIYGAMEAVMSLANRGAEMTDEIHRLKYAGQPETAERSVVETGSGDFFFDDDPLWRLGGSSGSVPIHAGQSFYDVSGGGERTEDRLRAAYAAAWRNARRYRVKRMYVRSRHRIRSWSARIRWAGGAAVAVGAIVLAALANAAADRLLGLLP